MALTSAATGLTVQQWDSKFFTQYQGKMRFKPLMGTSENAVIQVKDKLTNKKGKWDTFSLVNSLTGTGRTGKQYMKGFEEDMLSRSYKATVNKIRNAVVLPEIEQQYSAIDAREAAKAVLQQWILTKTRTDIIGALSSVAQSDTFNSSGVAQVWYADATTAQKNTWTVNNSDRVLFGAARSNYSATHATALANVDSTNDKLTGASLSAMKRIALSVASPLIRPVSTGEDEDVYIAFVPSFCFRDLRTDIKTQLADGWNRGKDNPLFRGGDLYWDGIIVKEIPEIAVISGVGASSIDVAPVYLCGAQAVGMVWAKRTTTRTDMEEDYGDKPGIEMHEIRAVEKLIFGTDATTETTTPKDNGVVTGFFSAVSD